MRLLVALTLLLNIGHSWGCEWNPAFVSLKAMPQPPDAFEGISHFMLVPFIIEQLGPAARDVGSGLYVLEWDSTDGRVFFMSTSSACGKPISVGFRKK